MWWLTIVFTKVHSWRGLNESFLSSLALRVCGPPRFGPGWKSNSICVNVGRNPVFNNNRIMVGSIGYRGWPLPRFPAESAPLRESRCRSVANHFRTENSARSRTPWHFRTKSFLLRNDLENILEHHESQVSESTTCRNFGAPKKGLWARIVFISDVIFSWTEAQLNSAVEWWKRETYDYRWEREY
jgi:hypothetical protein